METPQVFVPTGNATETVLWEEFKKILADVSLGHGTFNVENRSKQARSAGEKAVAFNIQKGQEYYTGPKITFTADYGIDKDGCLVSLPPSDNKKTKRSTGGGSFFCFGRSKDSDGDSMPATSQPDHSGGIRPRKTGQAPDKSGNGPKVEGKSGTGTTAPKHPGRSPDSRAASSQGASTDGKKSSGRWFSCFRSGDDSDGGSIPATSQPDYPGGIMPGKAGKVPSTSDNASKVGKASSWAQTRQNTASRGDNFPGGPRKGPKSNATLPQGASTKSNKPKRSTSCSCFGGGDKSDGDSRPAVSRYKNGPMSKENNMSNSGKQRSNGAKERAEKSRENNDAQNTQMNGKRKDVGKEKQGHSKKKRGKRWFCCL